MKAFKFLMKVLWLILIIAIIYLSIKEVGVSVLAGTILAGISGYTIVPYGFDKIDEL